MSKIEITLTVEHADLSRDKANNLVLHTFCEEKDLTDAIAKYYADVAANTAQVEANKQRESVLNNLVQSGPPATEG